MLICMKDALSSSCPSASELIAYQFVIIKRHSLCFKIKNVSEIISSSDENVSWWKYTHWYVKYSIATHVRQSYLQFIILYAERNDKMFRVRGINKSSFARTHKSFCLIILSFSFRFTRPSFLLLFEHLMSSESLSCFFHLTQLLSWFIHAKSICVRHFKSSHRFVKALKRKTRIMIRSLN